MHMIEVKVYGHHINLVDPKNTLSVNEQMGVFKLK